MLPAGPRTYLNRREPRVQRGTLTWFPLDGHLVGTGDTGGYQAPGSGWEFRQGITGPTLYTGSNPASNTGLTAAAMGVDGAKPRTCFFELMIGDANLTASYFGVGTTSDRMDYSVYRVSATVLRLNLWGADVDFTAAGWGDILIRGVWVIADGLSRAYISRYKLWTNNGEAAGVWTQPVYGSVAGTPNTPSGSFFKVGQGGSGNAITDGKSTLSYVGVLGGVAWNDGEAQSWLRQPEALWSPVGPIVIGKASGGGGTSYTLTADAGSFALAGQAAGLKAARRLTAAAGSFALTGQPAGLRGARKITATAGSFSLSGQAAGLRATRTLPASAAAYMLTGQAATLRAARLLPAGTGSFALTGQDASLTVSGSYSLSAGAGSFAISGQTARLLRGYRLAADAGAFTVTGQGAGLRAARRLSAAAGAFVLTGQAATLTVAAVVTGHIPATARAAGTPATARGSRTAATPRVF